MKMDNQNGFTLIEIIIATSIFAFMGTTIFTIVDQNATTKEEVVTEDRQFLQSVQALDRINKDILQIYSPLYYEAKFAQSANPNGGNSNKTNSSAFKAPVFTRTKRFPDATFSNKIIPILEEEGKTDFTFLTTTHRRKMEDEKSSYYTWIRYSLRTSDEEVRIKDAPNELVRQSSSIDIYEADFDWEKVREEVLLRGVKDFQFEFWNRTTKRWVTSLRQVPTDDENILRGLRVTMTWRDKVGNERENARIFRPFYPLFDTKKDLKDRTPKQTPSSNNTNSPQTPAPPAIN